MQAIVEHFQRLQDVAPVFTLVVEAFVEHIHDLVKVRRASKSDISKHSKNGLKAAHLLKVI
jgi:hypothetical protein